ncbi:M28 family peptidase [Draconibacterium sp. IB214405]|uniref:M28 family peptidase n=1 Tax=Draconibacterium sp. IB214405 TaxID=3097352 RepID=UPI002A17C407|nr:M28 family peptidase [Draconibacterium sp. IB214405]MDX8338213.1 M28 family peptidase [Draconibacterium sp. IB214405]
MRKKLCSILLFLFSISSAFAQYTPYYQYTLLPPEVMDEIIGESSGETAINHVIEMVGYQRNRPASEYDSAYFREGKYVLDKLNEYGIAGAKIERFDGGETWDGIKGELWEVEPGRIKLADYKDIALSLAEGSKPTDVTAELIWVEEGLENDFEGLDVKGKIVVTSGTVSRVHNTAVDKGALGVVAFGSSRELTAPLAIPASGIRGENATFGFYLTPREGYKLRDRLIHGEKIKVHAVVESQMLPYDLQVPTCVIPGFDPDAGEVILSAHIFEGYTKQGANDNVSGGAAILEVARIINQLVADGRIPQPKRSIRFIWVPEFSGTIPWVSAHADIMEQTLCNINLDMVGLHLKSNNSFFSMMRTTFGNPHYINDVMENYFVYMGEVNREILANRKNKRIANQIIAPSGTDDAFYYQIEQHYGSSDHEVFNNWTTHVPGVMLITWPDMYYHTSQDTPDKLDATQMKRAAVISAAGAYNIASADEEMAGSIAETSFTYGSKRMGIELGRALDELKYADAESFESTCKKVKAYLETTSNNELATLQSVTELAPNSKTLATQLETLSASTKQLFDANTVVLDNQITLAAAKLGVKVPTYKLTKLEKEASEFIPVPSEKIKVGAYRVEGAVRELPKEIQEKYAYKNIASTTELCTLINGKNSALDIKKMLDTENKEASDLQDILNYCALLKEAGLIN